MTEIRFYHLTATPFEKALPQLLLKVLEGGQRAVLLAANDEQLQVIDRFLWTFSTIKFIPHGTAKDGHEADQPVYLTLREENPNNAEMLVTVGGVEPEFVGKFARCLDIFDGGDAAAVTAARARWRNYGTKEGVTLTYWKQDDDGKWEKAA